MKNTIKGRWDIFQGLGIPVYTANDLGGSYTNLKDRTPLGIVCLHINIKVTCLLEIKMRIVISPAGTSYCIYFLNAFLKDTCEKHHKFL